MKRGELLDALSRFADLEEIVTKLDAAADVVRQDRQRSMLGTIAEFLESWPGDDEGFSRIIVRQTNNIVLTRRCLDPSLATKDLVEGAYCTITMSGTLSPAEMFADLLGIPASSRITKEYPSPFPAQNRLALAVPRTTTKFSQRSDAQYKSIAEYCARLTNQIPGCCAVFFPSYQIRDAVKNVFSQLSQKTLFLEQPNMTKEQKVDFLERFKDYKDAGAVLLAVASAVQQAIRYKRPLHVLTLPLCFFLYHFLHGIGVLWGLLRLLTGTASVQKIAEPWPGAGRKRAWTK